MKLDPRKPARVIELELSRPVEGFAGLEAYRFVRAIVRLHGTPLGSLDFPLTDGACSPEQVAGSVVQYLGGEILRELAANVLAAGVLMPAGDIRAALSLPAPAPADRLPSVTVAVCTRDRTDDLRLCLDALSRLDYPLPIDVLVVDNAPRTDATEQLVRDEFPRFRYAREPRPGLDWARNRAILETRGEIIAFTDDDCVVDRGWLRAVGAAFADDAAVDAITGLVVPYELETEAQLRFENHGGFARGFTRRWHTAAHPDGIRGEWYLGAGQFGTGANMAFRRALFARIGGFDPALDVGTVTNGGGDLDMYFRVLAEGGTLLYEPRALVRHRHRRGDEQLRSQMRTWGTGLVSYLAREWIHYPHARRSILAHAVWWVRKHASRRLLKSLMWARHRELGPLMLEEVRGVGPGLRRYQQARRRAREIVAEFGPMEVPVDVRLAARPSATGTAVRDVEITAPLTPLDDVTGARRTRVMLRDAGLLVGETEIHNDGRPISVARLRDRVAAAIGEPLFGGGDPTAEWNLRAEILGFLLDRRGAEGDTRAGEPVAAHALTAASIVVATYDRPDDLRECLRCLTAQRTDRPVEIIVVDNHPASGLTPPVVAEFAGVQLIAEPRGGLSYARNAGFTASTGALVVATDDDVTMPPGWLDKLLAPFAAPEVMIVTGNVLPRELETPSQHLFEMYGGLGRGFAPIRADRRWLESSWAFAAPTWTLGATANAAFRATAFAHPAIGMLDEALGAGTPTGCSEDTDLFYRVLKAGGEIRYNPTAYVWHRHRREMSALRRQIYSYSKGHVAYHLTTLLRHGDLRALTRFGWELPTWYARQTVRGFLGRGRYPLRLTIAEIAGSLAGPWSLWKSRRRVSREGRSAPYILPSERRPPWFAERGTHDEPFACSDNAAGPSADTAVRGGSRRRAAASPAIVAAGRSENRQLHDRVSSSP